MLHCKIVPVILYEIQDIVVIIPTFSKWEYFMQISLKPLQWNQNLSSFLNEQKTNLLYFISFTNNMLFILIETNYYCETRNYATKIIV